MAFWTEHLIFFSGAIGLLGLLLGSFLNVVIYRLPKMLEETFRSDCQLFLGLSSSESKAPFNLAVPRSRCPACQTLISAWDNIPLISFICLKGRCRHCHHPISWRYPFVELLMALLGAGVAFKWGVSWQTLFALFFIGSSIALCFIDWQTQLLPDQLTFPLLWAGLIANTFHLFTDLSSSVWGAVGGYLFLWTITQGYALITRKIGMGNGDFKLLAAIGAWMGWQVLPWVILGSSLLGMAGGFVLLSIRKESYQTPFAFGPYLILNGGIALLCLNTNWSWV